MVVFDTSSEVSKLVSRAFRSVPKPIQNDSGVVSAVLKLMGLEGQKIGAIAVNSIVMVSQLVRSVVEKVTYYTKGKLIDWYIIIKAIQQNIAKNQTDTNSILVFADKMI